MENSYWSLFLATGDPDMYMKFKEGELTDGTAENDRDCPPDEPGKKQ